MRLSADFGNFVIGLTLGLVIAYFATTIIPFSWDYACFVLPLAGAIICGLSSMISGGWEDAKQFVVAGIGAALGSAIILYVTPALHLF